jgi:hypothetical protein
MLGFKARIINVIISWRIWRNKKLREIAKLGDADEPAPDTIIELAFSKIKAFSALGVYEREHGFTFGASPRRKGYAYRPLSVWTRKGSLESTQPLALRYSSSFSFESRSDYVQVNVATGKQSETSRLVSTDDIIDI